MNNNKEMTARRNNALKVLLPFIPVGAWEYSKRSYLTGHMYRNNPYETCDSCGNCDGAVCADDNSSCTRITSENITLDNNVIPMVLQIMGMCGKYDDDIADIALDLDVTIEDIYNIYPMMYDGIISYLRCPDLVRKHQRSIEAAKKVEEERKAAMERERRLEKEKARKMQLNSRKVYLKEDYARIGFFGTFNPIQANDHSRVRIQVTSDPGTYRGRGDRVIMTATNEDELLNNLPTQIRDGARSKIIHVNGACIFEIKAGWIADMGLTCAYESVK